MTNQLNPVTYTAMLH